MALESRPEQSPKHRRGFADEARFIGAWFRNPKKTGAVAPSSARLGALMASYVDPAVSGPVIELGPGTGPVTQALLERGLAPERLFLIEYSKDFARLLRQRFPGVHVIEGDAYAVRETLAGRIDRAPIAVVSSLPLLTRPEAARAALIGAALDMATPHAPFIQFTYGGTPPAPLRSLAGYSAEKSRTIWWNLPPARVFVYRRTSEARAIG
jgi:phosphatidylethanolamine/phosphatidyl-N-methylethanolamine N-methyltransferase